MLRAHGDGKCMKTLMIHRGNKRISVPFNAKRASCFYSEDLNIIKPPQDTVYVLSHCQYLSLLHHIVLLIAERNILERLL